MKRGNFDFKLMFDGIKILDEKNYDIEDVEKSIRKIKVKFR